MRKETDDTLLQQNGIGLRSRQGAPRDLMQRTVGDEIDSLQVGRENGADGPPDKGCKAGHRFLVVTADGALQPCSMQFHRYRLEERGRMIDEFTEHNACDECYVSIRSYLDKSFPRLFRENVAGFFSTKA